MATETDSVRTDAIGTVMTVLALVVVVGAFAVTALVRTEERNLAAVRETTANLRPLRDLRAKQVAELNGATAWVNRDQSVISVPIAKAMELVVQEERIASKLPTKAENPGAGTAGETSSTAATAEKSTANVGKSNQAPAAAAESTPTKTETKPQPARPAVAPQPLSTGPASTNSASP
jgi:hypothetical protein